MQTYDDFDPRAGVCRVPHVAPECSIRLIPAFAWVSADGTTVDQQGWQQQHLSSSIDAITAALRAQFARPATSPAAVAPKPTASTGSPASLPRPSGS